MKKKNTEKLVDAIGMINDEYVEEAHAKKKFNFRFSWALMGKIMTAACAVLLTITILPNFFHSYKGSNYAAEYKTDGSYSDEAISGYAFDSYSGYDVEESMASTNGPAELNNDMRANKKLILTANMSLESQALDETTAAITALVNKYGGYVQRSSVYTRSGYRYYEATFRIPADKYTEFLEELKVEGNTTSYSEETKDVTDSYTDLQARIASLKAQEAKVLEFYDKAESIEDLMSIESRLSDIRYEIEYLEAQIKNYDLLTAYSTLNLTITETKAYTPVNTSFWSRLASSFTSGWTDFIDGIGDFVIDIVYNMWTIILLVAIGYLAYFLYKKFRNRKR